MSVDVLRPIWNSYKYKIEATIPEPNICTDCILSRLTIINVEASDLGSYVINATTNYKPYRTALDSISVYGKEIDIFLFEKYFLVIILFFQKHLIVNNSSRIEITSVANESVLQRVHHQFVFHSYCCSH